MPTLKSNYLRIQITSQCYRYQIQIISNNKIDPKYYHQIQSYFTSLQQFIVFSYPFIYSTIQLVGLKNFYFMLSNGEKIHIIKCQDKDILTLNSKEIAKEINTQIMKKTNFLYNFDMEICLNPFQERIINDKVSIMPGFTIQTEIINSINATQGFYLIPLQVKIQQFQSLSSLVQDSTLLDYNSGNFYKKSSIVRYDKIKQQIHFRTGQILSKNYLKSVTVIHITGYQFAVKLNNYFQRIKKSEKLAKFIEIWEIKFDSRFLDLPYNFFTPCHILTRNNQERSLGQVIGSISAYNYQHNCRKLFSNLTFDDKIRAHIYFLLPQISISQSQQLGNRQIQLIAEGAIQQQRVIIPILAQMQGIKKRMSLDQCYISFYRYNLYSQIHNGYKQTFTQIDSFIAKEKQKNNIQRIFILSNYQDVLYQQRNVKFIISPKNQQNSQKQEQKFYQKLIQHFIQTGTYFHLLNLKDNEFSNYQDILAMKLFSTIYTKLRLNPWKIKDVPFGTKPLIVFSIYLKFYPNNTVNISVVGTLNAFLSKYVAVHIKCKIQEYMMLQSNLIKQCIQKFKSIHKIAPIRAMIFRTGDNMDKSEPQLRQIENLLITNYNCRPTFILLDCNSSPLRVYNQIDMNYISTQTVKPTQLLCQFKYKNDRYIQLQNDTPLYKISIINPDLQDPYFQQKCVQLTVKLIFTYSIFEMKFGKGLGFINFAKKLNQFQEKYDISQQKIKEKLKQGVLLFL